MKTLLLLWFTFFSSILFAQTTDSSLHRDYSKITKQDAALLNAALQDKLQGFDFTDKKVAFVTGSLGNSIMFPDNWVIKYLKPETIISFVNLSAEEKEKSGGYDAIVIYYVKMFSDKQKRKIIKRLKSQNK